MRRTRSRNRKRWRNKTGFCHRIAQRWKSCCGRNKKPAATQPIPPMLSSCIFRQFSRRLPPIPSCSHNNSNNKSNMKSSSRSQSRFALWSSTTSPARATVPVPAAAGSWKKNSLIVRARRHQTSSAAALELPRPMHCWNWKCWIRAA